MHPEEAECVMEDEMTRRGRCRGRNDDGLAYVRETTMDTFRPSSRGASASGRQPSSSVHGRLANRTTLPTASRRAGTNASCAT